MLEFRADPDSPYYDKNFAKDKASSSIAPPAGVLRSLVGVLKDMGYVQVYNMGAFKDWAENGGNRNADRHCHVNYRAHMFPKSRH